MMDYKDDDWGVFPWKENKEDSQEVNPPMTYRGESPETGAIAKTSNKLTDQLKPPMRDPSQAVAAVPVAKKMDQAINPVKPSPNGYQPINVDDYIDGVPQDSILGQQISSVTPEFMKRYKTYDPSESKPFYERLYSAMYADDASEEQGKKASIVSALSNAVGGLGNYLASRIDASGAKQGAITQQRNRFASDEIAANAQRIFDRYEQARERYRQALLAGKAKDADVYDKDFQIGRSMIDQAGRSQEASRQAKQEAALKLALHNQQMQYKAGRDKTEDDRWEKQFKEASRHNRASEAIARQRAYSSGSRNASGSHSASGKIRVYDVGDGRAAVIKSSKGFDADAYINSAMAQEYARMATTMTSTELKKEAKPYQLRARVLKNPETMKILSDAGVSVEYTDGDKVSPPESVKMSSSSVMSPSGLWSGVHLTGANTPIELGDPIVSDMNIKRPPANKPIAMSLYDGYLGKARYADQLAQKSPDEAQKIFLDMYNDIQSNPNTSFLIPEVQKAMKDTGNGSYEELFSNLIKRVQ